MLRDKVHCYGCSACVDVCPKNAIEVKADAEGFIYPSVIGERCIHCGACERVCNERGHLRILGDAYIAQSDDDAVLLKSTSGGVIPEIAKQIVAMNGTVCSTTYRVNEGGRWQFIDNESSLRDFCGSKYFQIPLTKEVMDSIRGELNNRIVLFVGTPCQVNAINNVVGDKNRGNLYTIDLICGGTVSDKFERGYVSYEERVADKKQVIEHLFRSKSQGWSRKYLTEIKFVDGSIVTRKGSDSLFTRAYNCGMFLRPSCYNCEFCTKNRAGDVTVGDCWGIGKESPFEISKGVSMVFLNTERGKRLFESSQGIRSTAIDRDTLAKENKPLYTTHKRKALRNVSYQLLNAIGFKKAVNICAYRYHVKRMIGRS
jgi:coenzyme F420-reducing hydrogenase beta subunit